MNNLNPSDASNAVTSESPERHTGSDPTQLSTRSTHHALTVALPASSPTNYAPIVARSASQSIITQYYRQCRQR